MNYYQKQKGKVFDILGRKCVECGFDKIDAITIDHVFNDGAAHRRIHKAGTSQYINDILRSVKANEGRYQTLCMNCNSIKEARRRREEGKQ